MPVPLLLGFVLGPMMEVALRRALMTKREDYTVFFTRPISTTLLVLTLPVICLTLLPQVRKRRQVLEEV